MAVADFFMRRAFLRDPWAPPAYVPGGFVAFHDYADSAPGVRRSVNELLRDRLCEFVTQKGAMIVCRKPR